MTDPLFEHIEEQERDSRLAQEQLQQAREELAATLQQTRHLRQQLAYCREELAASVRVSLALHRRPLPGDAGQPPGDPITE
jgi:hypothetical protein